MCNDDVQFKLIFMETIIMLYMEQSGILPLLPMLMMLFSSYAQPSLAEHLKTDALLQENTIILIRSALG